MRSLSLAFALSSTVLFPACMSPDPQPSDSGDEHFIALRPPELIVKELTILDGREGPFGLWAVPLEIMIQNVPPKNKLMLGQTTQDPFEVSIALSNPLLVPQPPVPGQPPPPPSEAITAPVAFGYYGLATQPWGTQQPADRTLTVRVPVKSGQTIPLKKTAYFDIPWELPVVDAKTSQAVQLELTATVDWTNAIWSGTRATTR